MEKSYRLYAKILYIGFTFLLSPGISLGAGAYENAYPLIASSAEGQVLFAFSNKDRTILGFIECELYPIDLQKPLLSISPEKRRCMELGTVINTSENQERFDSLFVSSIHEKSLSAGVGIHTMSYIVSGITGLLTAGYIGLGASVGEGVIAFRQASPYVILTIVAGAIGYYLHDKALKEARVEQFTVEFAIRHRKEQVLKSGEVQDPELLRSLDESDLSQKIYQIFRESINETIEFMTTA